MSPAKKKATKRGGLGGLMKRAQDRAKAKGASKTKPAPAEKLVTKSLTLTPEALDILTALAADASKLNSRKVSPAAIVRALLKHWDDHNFPIKRLAELAELENKEGSVIWGRKPGTRLKA